jgi:hypothetical protein
MQKSYRRYVIQRFKVKRKQKWLGQWTGKRKMTGGARE